MRQYDRFFRDLPAVDPVVAHRDADRGLRNAFRLREILLFGRAVVVAEDHHVLAPDLRHARVEDEARFVGDIVFGEDGFRVFLDAGCVG